MATESADGTDGPLSLPPPLEEWLDDRAASLEMSREELLVQVASAYRATSASSASDPTPPSRSAVAR